MTEENFYRESWMTDDQWECADFFAYLVGGWHHVMGKLKKCGTGVLFNSRNYGWATFDFNHLTRAVVLAHDRMIRFEIRPSAPGMLQFVIHKRHTREGNMAKRHPTIEDAIKAIRQK
ncbi:MAG: hypothetical protein GY941_01080 [Planctomycetes bacterium]|nr:hypothetical protein [Planctomycetota bacterium]